MSEKLLPCPWCGPRGDVQVTQYGRDYFSIKCRECGCEGPHRTMGHSLVNGEELAIDEWNTRAAMQADAAPVATYRHKKRGTLYTVLGEGALQCSANERLDNQPIVVYRGEDGKLWARGVAEFHDGRFEAVGDRVSTSSPVVAHETPETSGKLRDAVEVWEDAYRAWDDAPTNPDRIGDEDRAAAAVIEADRAALVAEIVADLREDAKQCDCFARSEGECACGAWSDYKQKPVSQIADMIEAKWGGK